MILNLKRLTILIVAILVVAGVDGAFRGLRMPPEASGELSAGIQQRIAEARASRGSSSAELASAPDGSAGAQVPVEDSADGLGMTTADLHAAWEAELVTLVDARTPIQYGQGHIPGAFSVPFEQMATGYPAALDSLPYDVPIVVYCDGGDCNASRNVASLLLDMGFEEVTIFERGMEAWLRHGHPVVTGSGEMTAQ